MYTLDMLIEALAVFPVEIVLTYMMTLMLTMRSNAVFWLVRMGLSSVSILARPFLGEPLHMAMALFLYLVLPVLCARDSLARRLFVVVAIYIVMAVSEVAGMLMWSALTGLALSGPGDMAVYTAQYWLVRVLHLMLTTFLLMALHVLIRRISGEDYERGMASVVALPAVEVVLFAVVIQAFQYVPEESYTLTLISAVLTIACVGVDAYLLLAVERYGKKRRSERQARALAMQLDDYLERYASVVEGVGAVARLRHDVRNQLQVIGDLTSRGEYEKAREMARSLRAHCEKTSVQLGATCPADPAGGLSYSGEVHLEGRHASEETL